MPYLLKFGTFRELLRAFELNAKHTCLLIQKDYLLKLVNHY